MAGIFDQPHTDTAGLLEIAKKLYKGFGNNPRNKETLDALLGVTGVTPGVGDVQSGIMATQDLKKGNYGSAALNSLGLLPFIPALGGTFIGKNSKLWNPNQEQMFMKLEKKGLSPEEIWSKTGTLRAPDKMLRQEIPDTQAKITDAVYEGIKNKKRYFGKMGEALEHPELYKSYPESADVNAIMYATPEGHGNFWDTQNEIMVGGPGTTTQKSVSLHELQHWIQNKEGWARGGSPEYMGGYANKYNQAKTSFDEALKTRLNPNAGEIEKDNARQIMEHYGPQLSKLKTYSDPNAAYRRLAGEAEARLTQRRMNLTPEERLKYYPWSNTTMGEYGLDVPYDELIVRGILND